MKFEIVFASHPGWPVEMPYSSIGLIDVSFIRQNTVENLDLDLVEGYIQDLRISPEITVCECYARSAGHFNYGNRANIRVKRNFLNQFVIKQVKTETSNKDGKILKAWIVYKLDKEAVLSAWADAGYPIQWGFEEEEEKE